jgi:Domain of unknown function (DUF4145)
MEFIIDCPVCKRQVVAIQTGHAVRRFRQESGELFGEKLVVGKCPHCQNLLAAHTTQIDFTNFLRKEKERQDARDSGRFSYYDDDDDNRYDDKDFDPPEIWSRLTRIYPNPTKTFSSSRIPPSVKTSLADADKALQADASIASCVMFGRALEAVCRDVLLTDEEKKAVKVGTKRKRVMLGLGIRQLRDKNIIDDRLFDWSQHLHAFRNLAAHPEDDETLAISRQDAEDLQAFVYAIIEYIYDLTDRYQAFKGRQSLA